MSYCVQGEQLLEVAKKGDAVAVERLLKNNDIVNYKDMVWVWVWGRILPNNYM